MTTQVMEQPTENQEMDEADFSASFKEETGQKPTDTPATPATPATETAAAPEPQNEPETPQAEPAPEYVQLTKAERDELLKFRELQNKLDQGFGTLGNIQQTIKQLQEARTKGTPVEITDEDLAELRAEFPEFAELTKKGLSRVLSRLASGSAPADTTAITQAEERAIQREQKAAVTTLDVLVEDWRTITGVPDDQGKLPDNDYHRWLATQTPEYRQTVLDAWNPHVIAKSIEKFQTFQKTQAEEAKKKPEPPKANERTTRLAAAVPPKGVAPAGAQPEESGFSSAFNEERKSMGR